MLSAQLRWCVLVWSGAHGRDSEGTTTEHQPAARARPTGQVQTFLLGRQTARGKAL
jgi:hypothetical protein